MLKFFKTDAPETEPNYIILNSQKPEIRVLMRYSNKAKHISIRIRHDGPELILPNKKSASAAGKKFLLTKESWIRGKLRNTSEVIPSNIIPIFGEKHSLEFIDTPGSMVEIIDCEITVYAKPLKHKEKLIKFLQNMLLHEIIPIAESISKEHGLRYSEIKISNNKSKWGCCSSGAVIAFNWRLVFAPKEILRYLIAHEMSHLKEMNHSPNFWKLVEKIYPEYKAPKLWLKKNGMNLQRIAHGLTSKAKGS